MMTSEYMQTIKVRKDKSSSITTKTIEVVKGK